MKAAFNKHYNHDKAGSLSFAGSGSILTIWVSDSIFN